MNSVIYSFICGIIDKIPTHLFIILLYQINTWNKFDFYSLWLNDISLLLL